ncbi:hypothetical protein KVR01_009776 [Diaporthe batatas]|uniref:uncharacterized protein n=1 Tax=Diaporthe batatas TaxID=748121 RepID=UPI001D05AB18|nr:uncharacterized protein KVR01_009776 [Diaporthe batatas]KAG8160240.1 hypothetical protein KVR01_009776 [Diaporthe batatas]
MPYLQGASAADSALVPLGKLQRRFYEPVVLLLALTQACMHNYAPRVAESLAEVPSHSPDELFKDFVNKLCQICDNRRGGDAVTAISVLQYPDRVQYRFASNQRSEKELLKVKSYLEGILETLKGYSPSSSNLLMASVLRKIVAFNRLRLQGYIRYLYSQTQICLDTPKLSTDLSDKVREVQDLVKIADNRELDEPAFFKACANLMLCIKAFSKSPTYKSLHEKASSESGESSPWAELRHNAGRLLSYYQASRTLIEARKKWERLFYEVEVNFIPSSTPLVNPVNDKRVDADAIIGRMTSDKTEMRQYRAHADELQRFDLDTKIQDQVSKGFKALVHAEVLLLQSLIDEFSLSGLHPSCFFERRKYIGSSKPTCRLCAYYFTASATDIDVRKTHRNVYINWRAPDVYVRQGEAAKKWRQQILMKVLDRVREDAFRTLAEKVPERKRYDSNTDPTFPTLNQGTSVGFDGAFLVDTDLDDVAASMCRLDLHDSHAEGREVQPGPSISASSGFDGVDDDGGAPLS